MLMERLDKERTYYNGCVIPPPTNKTARLKRKRAYNDLVKGSDVNGSIRKMLLEKIEEERYKNDIKLVEAFTTIEELKNSYLAAKLAQKKIDDA